MNPDFVNLLRCPSSGQKLKIKNVQYEGSRIKNGILLSEDELFAYPIQDYIPRFVPLKNYADNFGMQWNRFSKTQLDSYSGLSISAERFWKSTEWISEKMDGKWVLDAGCGAGRFAEIALHTGAKVVALDYSNAVDACYANLEHYKNLYVVQGDIYNLPFAPESFDYVYSLGVLQHTPDVEKAFYTLVAMLKKGGGLCVDFYEKSFKRSLLPKYWLRPITKRMDKLRLLNMVEITASYLLTISQFLGRIPFLGKFLKRIVPVANYEGIYKLSKHQVLEWAILDTFDWLSPTYDYPQSAKTVRKWANKAGLEEIKIFKLGHLVLKGRK